VLGRLERASLNPFTGLHWMLCFLVTKMMDEVHNSSDFECYTPLSECYRFCDGICLVRCNFPVECFTIPRLFLSAYLILL
jgi:hypothetical protein